MRTVYVSQNGMLENLGQSQVLPYLRGLAKRDVAIDLFAFELAGADEGAIVELGRSLRADGIHYHPLVRKKDTRLRVKAWESGLGVAALLGTVLAKRPVLVHGRSYFATAICDLARRVSPRTKLLFDCRGMIADEYLDCRHWTRDRPEYYLVKEYEQHAFKKADGVVVLTRALRDWLAARGWFGAATSVEAIPCCVDIERFRFDAERRAKARKELAVDRDLAIVYSGSLGTWYLEDEMARYVAAFARHAKRAGRDATFLVFTPSDAESLRARVADRGFPIEKMRVQRVKPQEMPRMLAAGDVGVSFIQSCFSKKGSSPTKVAEYLAAGMPVVLNGDIGDQADLAAEKDACVVLSTFSDAEIERAAIESLRLAELPFEARARAALAIGTRHFSLEDVGVRRYERLYRALAARA